MTGLEYMRTVCPTTKVGKDPMREDVADAFEDGIAEGWKQYKKKQWKPSDEQLEALEYSLGDYNIKIFEDRYEILKSLYQDLKKLKE